MRANDEPSPIVQAVIAVLAAGVLYAWVCLIFSL